MKLARHGGLRLLGSFSRRLRRPASLIHPETKPDPSSSRISTDAGADDSDRVLLLTPTIPAIRMQG